MYLDPSTLESIITIVESMMVSITKMSSALDQMTLIISSKPSYDASFVDAGVITNVVDEDANVNNDLAADLSNEQCNNELCSGPVYRTKLEASTQEIASSRVLTSVDPGNQTPMLHDETFQIAAVDITLPAASILQPLKVSLVYSPLQSQISFNGDLLAKLSCSSLTTQNTNVGLLGATLVILLDFDDSIMSLTSQFHGSSGWPPPTQSEASFSGTNLVYARPGDETLANSDYVQNYNWQVLHHQLVSWNVQGFGSVHCQAMDVMFLFTIGQSIILMPEEIIPIVAMEPSVAPVITMLHLHLGSNFIATYLAHDKSEAVSATSEPLLCHEVASIVADKRVAQQYVVNSFVVQFHEHLLGPIASITQVNYLSVLVAVTCVQGYTDLILALLSSMIHSEGATSLIYPECAIHPTFMLLVKTEFATTALQPCIAYAAIRTLVAAVGGELIHPSCPYLLLFQCSQSDRSR